MLSSLKKSKTFFFFFFFFFNLFIYLFTHYYTNTQIVGEEYGSWPPD